MSWADTVRGIAYDEAAQRGADKDASTTAPAIDPAFSSASAMVTNALRAMGLEGEVDWAMGVLKQNLSPDEVLLQLRERPAYKIRFAANEERRKRGLPMLSEGEIIAYERTARQLMRETGLPPGFYDSPDDFVGFIGRDVSVKELQDRVDTYRSVADSIAADPENQGVLAELHRIYGITPDSGAFLAYAIDPDRALTTLQRQVAAAGTSTAARRSGYGALNQAEAERVAALGVTQDQAVAGFGELVGDRELFGALPGEERTTGAIGRDEQLNAIFARDAIARQRIMRRSAERAAAFGGGGSYGLSQQGVAGLGRAAS